MIPICRLPSYISRKFSSPLASSSCRVHARCISSVSIAAALLTPGRRIEGKTRKNNREIKETSRASRHAYVRFNADAHPSPATTYASAYARSSPSSSSAATGPKIQQRNSSGHEYHSCGICWSCEKQQQLWCALLFFLSIRRKYKIALTVLFIFGGRLQLVLCNFFVR